MIQYVHLWTFEHRPQVFVWLEKGNWSKEISDDGRYLFFNNAEFGRSVNLNDMDIHSELWVEEPF